MRARPLLPVLAVLALLPVTLPAVGQVAPISVIVVLEPDPRPVPQVAQEVARAHGGQVGYVYTEALQGFSLRVAPNAVAGLERDPRVDYVEPDVPVSIAAQTPSTGIDRVEADRNPGASSYAGVDLAVLDTGIYIGQNPDGSARGHLDLNLIRVTDCTGAIYYPLFGGCSGSGNFQDENGHGTHVAGIAGARNNDFGALGSAPGVALWSVKVLNGDGSGSLGSVLAGIDLVTTYASEIEVANMSLGVEGTYESLDTAITNSVAAGVVYVVAAGNSGKDSSGFSPAGHPDVITTSALADFDGLPGGLGDPTCRNDVQDDHLATWSNYGDPVDIASPGVCIFSTWLGDGYHTISGTSMAAPLVAGAAARYIAEHGRAGDRAGVLAIRDALVAGAVPQDSACGFAGDPDSSPEPLLFLNGSAFAGGDGTCDSQQSDNAAPSVSITSPSDGTIVTEGDSVTFTGSADDADDGDLSASISWSSDLDGAVGTGASVSTSSLSVGVHTITASVTDTGSLSDSASITLTVEAAPAGNTAPSVTIDVPEDGAIVTEGDPVTFTGSADDAEDGDLSASISWSSDLDGAVGTGASVSTSSLSVGVHTITASVTDTGSLSDSASITLTVEEAAPPEPATLHVGDLDGSSTADKSRWTATVTILVEDDAHAPVAGATVAGSWDGAGTGSCETETNGTCTVVLGGLHKRVSSATFAVTSVSGTLTYEASDNHDPDGDSDGTTITIPKP